MGKRLSKQDRALNGKYEKYARCEICNESLGDLDNNEWFYGIDEHAGQFLCLDCGRKYGHE